MNEQSTQKHAAKARILVIDDDDVVVAVVQAVVAKQGHQLDICRDGREGIQFLSNQPHPDLILLDLMMPHVDGFGVLKWVRQHPELVGIPVICITNLDDANVIGRVFESGAADYIGKPIRPYELLARIRLHLTLQHQHDEIRRAQTEVLALRDGLFGGELQHPSHFSHIITDDSAMKAVFHYIEAVAPGSRPVLVTGETGTGKELIARSIHDVSGRRGNFVAVNVAGLDDNLFSDALFGHDKGAFTGAVRERRGLVEEAAGGTLFLDEIGDLVPASQVKLLRLLQEHEYYRLGSDDKRSSDARVVVATHQGLDQKAAVGDFRSDLYYRLSAHQVKISPLRERSSDIPLLFMHFLKQAAADLQVEPPEIGEDEMDRLEAREFPGNIRELEGVAHDRVTRARLTAKPAPSASVASPKQALVPAVDPGHSFVYSSEEFPTLKSMTGELIDQAIARSRNQAGAAKLLGISRQALNKRLKSKE
ncbi:MAG: DNA-binding NtrC family response regulator [Rhodothermales bacterium]|jgi:DNA-binding NtrC family response regulator